ncbi:amidohydrolase family protein [Roseomonas sp. NAR14]|uniref:Amidohydrolase family protein n=1 Tax=Roseomonas acroporae TaxID=2937791 RepID=A0A9X2BXF8_9PROT|nr:amidohydrolase family protein [Roseomonas acroporae]
MTGGFCDSHIHVVADVARRPMIPGRAYTPGVATVDQVRRLGAPHGVTRFVVVQPSFYGTDNTVLVEALRELGGDGRGVAVLDPAEASEGELAALHAAGVRGLRLNLYSGHGAPADDRLAERFGAAAALAARQGWHVQVIAPLPVLAGAAPVLARAAVPLVIDHYGLPGGHAPGGEAGRALLGLLARPQVWVKLSAPYRSTGEVLGVAPDAAWLAAILGVAADRCVWGSDWPHTPPHEAQPGGGAPLPYRALDYGRVVAGFRAALPSAALADRIMGANAARLYGFAG